MSSPGALLKTAALSACVAAGLGACAVPAADVAPPPVAVVQPWSEVADASYRIADQLAGSADVGLGQPLLVATLVDVSDTRRSSPLGRIMSEQIGARLSRLGLPVAEIKLRHNVLVEEGAGELALSREVHNLVRQRAVQAVVVGTYAVGAASVLINARMVAAVDGRLLAAVDYVLPLTADVAALLGPGGGPGLHAAAVVY